MAARNRQFHRGLSTDGLLEWLEVGGLGELDRKKIGGMILLLTCTQQVLRSLIDLSRARVHWGVFPTPG